MDWTSLAAALKTPLHEFALHVAEATAILVLGGVMARTIGPIVGWVVRRLAGADQTRNHSILGQLAGLATIVAAIAAALSVLGAGPILGVIGAVVLSLGSLTDAYYGLRLMLMQTMRLGDAIEIDASDGVGLLTRITLSSFTLLKLPSHDLLVYPNRVLADKRLRIFNREQGQWVDLNVEVPAGSPAVVSAHALCDIFRDLRPDAMGRAPRVAVQRIDAKSVLYRVSFGMRQGDHDLDSELMQALAARLGDIAFVVSRA